MSYKELKDRLYESFIQTKERGLTDEQVRLAKNAVAYGKDLQSSRKYDHLQFLLLIKRNGENYMKLINALGLVLQYITDLLSPELPPNWWSISTKNRTYAFRMANMVGIEDIFMLAGYTRKSKDFLTFPEGDNKKPDREHLAALATEILIAREECSAAQQGLIKIQFDECETFAYHQEPEVPIKPRTSYQPPVLSPNQVPIIRPRTNYQPAISPRTNQPTAISQINENQQSEQHNQYTNACQPLDEFSLQPLQSNNCTLSSSCDQPTFSIQLQNPPKPKPRKNIQRKLSDSSNNSSSPPLQTKTLTESGSENSSVLETQNQTSSTNDSMDSSMPSFSAKNKARKESLKKKIEEFKERQKLLKRQNTHPDPSAPHQGNIPAYYSSPQDSSSFSNNLQPSNDSLNVAKRGGLATTVQPFRPAKNLNLKFSSPIDEHEEESYVQEYPPMSPEKCPHCQNHLNESSICTYCTIATSPLEPVPKQCRPIPRPRANKQPQASIQPSNPLPTDNTLEISNKPSCNPGVISVSHHIEPANKEFEKGEDTGTMKNNNEVETNSLTSDEATLTSTNHLYDDSAPSISDKQLDQQFEKFTKERDYFDSLSLEEQDMYLNRKVQFGDTINHLKPHYKGRNWFARKEEAEISRFRELSLAEQKKIIEEKNIKQEKISHLVPYYSTSTLVGKVFEKDKKAQRLQYKEKVRLQGKQMCNWIKICAKEGFRPKEVEIAFHHYQSDNPLNFLQTEWQRRINSVETMFEFEKTKAGQPSHEEMRNFLIQTKGKVAEAKTMCLNNRLEKINELKDRLPEKLKVERHVLVDCLDQCDLDVEEAFYAVQRTTLLELYRYMTSSKWEATTTEAMQGGDKTNEPKAAIRGKSDMDLMKQKVLDSTKDKDNKSHSYQFCVRMLIAENKFKDTKKAIMLIDLIRENSEYPMKYYIDAVRHYDTIEEASRFLNQDCLICTDKFVMDDMVVMPACGCSLCRHCFIYNFKVTIKEKSVKHFNCPLCGEPDMSKEAQDMNIELFVALVKELCDKEIYDLCQQKLTDFNLSKSPNFVWCINEKCRSGFLTDREDRLRAECPNCHKDMCFLCKKKWEHQHEGITCDNFAQWKIDNDPEAQKQGLAAHLEENGIECPSCKFRYDLARGGCMHFRCTQCPVEFCSGCGGHIKKGEDCGKYESCKKLGLHAHHPRDCLFYLRDFSVDKLQGLLVKNNVKFDTETPKAQLDAARQEQKLNQGIEEADDDEEDEDAVLGEPIVADEEDKPDEPAEPVELTCCVMLQKEGPEGLYDEKCGQPTPEKMAGLCETHYKEYLVGKINKAKVDPIDLYAIFQLERILQREEKDIPEKDDDDENNEDEYKEKLINHIKRVLPIQREKAVNFVSKN